jgi:transcription initiation factor TFIID subunit 11
MASPPHRSPATSPPYPSHSNLPTSRKRPLPTISTNPQYPNKRVNSSFSNTGSTHPLRQTSFPPEEPRDGERSPSVESIVTAGTGARSVTASTLGKKKARKKKDDTQSVRSAGRGSVAEDARSRTGGGQDDEELEEDDEPGAAAADLVETGAKVDDAHEQQRIAYGSFFSYHFTQLTLLVYYFQLSVLNKASDMIFIDESNLRKRQFEKLSTRHFLNQFHHQ